MPAATFDVQLTEGVAPDYTAGVLSWRTALAGERRSPKTIAAYLMALRRFAAFLVAQGMPTDPAAITGEHVRECLTTQRAPATARLRYSALRRFFGFLVAEGELRRNPMANVRPPSVPDDEAGRPFLDDEAFAKILATTKRSKPPTFTDRRDAAILLVLRTGGLRRAECAALEVGDVDTGQGTVLVRHGKGGKARVAAIDDKAVAAVIRYLGARPSRGPTAAGPSLWLTTDGRPLGPEAVSAVVERRAEAAGLGHITAHQLRHLYADSLKRAGASDETLRALGGWADARTLTRYGKARQRERAIDEYRRLRGRA